MPLPHNTHAGFLGRATSFVPSASAVAAGAREHARWPQCPISRAQLADAYGHCTRPMGWRSWNCYHGDVSQTGIEATIDAIVDKSRGTSLLELGFTNVGVDDGWQACGTGRELNNHSSFHAADGTPLVNKTKFPDVKAMVAYGHKNKGLTMGWCT